MVSEQRKHTRLPLDGRVSFRMENGHLVLVQGHLNNFGLGGFGVLTREEIDKDEKVDFVLEAPSLGHSLRGKGKVKNIRKTTKMGDPYYSMGIEFTAVDKKKLLDLIEKKKGGWDKKMLIVREHKSDIFTAVKLAPILFFIAWLAFRCFCQIETSNREEKRYADDFRRGVIHSLFNSK